MLPFLLLFLAEKGSDLQKYKTNDAEFSSTKITLLFFQLVRVLSSHLSLPLVQDGRLDWFGSPCPLCSLPSLHKPFSFFRTRRGRRVCRPACVPVLLRLAQTEPPQDGPCGSPRVLSRRTLENSFPSFLPSSFFPIQISLVSSGLEEGRKYPKNHPTHFKAVSVF